MLKNYEVTEMTNIRLEKIDFHLKKKLKNKEFKKYLKLEKDKVELAQKISELRQEKNLKQADLAKRLHVSQQFISQIETAQENNLTIDTLLKLAESLGRSVEISFPKVSKQHNRLIVA